MKLAIAAAKLEEVSALITFLQNQAQQIKPFHFRFKSLEIQILITGEDILRTTYALTRYFQHQSTDFFIHSGLAIRLSGELEEAKVYQVSNDIFFSEKIIDRNLSELIDANSHSELPFENDQFKNPQTGQFLPLAVSITLNSGRLEKKAIKTLSKNHGASLLLTKDNSAVFFVAIMEKINFLSIRATLAKNEVEANLLDNKKQAISLLNTNLIDIILTLSE